MLQRNFETLWSPVLGGRRCILPAETDDRLHLVFIYVFPLPVLLGRLSSMLERVLEL
jgi:hypothetical protein